MSYGFNYKKYNRERMNNFLDFFPVGDKLTIIGKAESEIYKNTSNGFSVYTVKVEKNVLLVEEGKEEDHSAEGTVRVTGFINLNVGQKFKIKGEVQKYNSLKQLFMESSEYIEPTSTDGIIAFLSSDLIKGVGEKTADKIVNGYEHKGKFIEGFGENTLDIIRTNYTELARVPGISMKKAKTIHDTYIKNIEYQNVMFFFQKYNITPAKIMKVYKEFKEKSIDIVKNNPFILAKRIKGFGFKVCDEIARKMGQNPHDIERIKTGIIYTLQEATTDGHCYLKDTELFKNTVENTNIIYQVDRARKLLSDNRGKDIVEIKIDGLTYEIPYAKLEYMVVEVENDKKSKWKKDLKVIIDKISEIEVSQALEQLVVEQEVVSIVHNNDNCIYLQELYDTELEVAQHIRRIINSKVQKVDDDIEKHIEEFENMKGFTLEKKQREAVEEIFTNNIMVLTGAAGSGKTTTVEAMIYVLNKVYSKKGLDFMLSAPTGRASKRLTEVTKFPAKTIHRLLEYGPEGFTFNYSNPLPYDVIVADEFSMTDIFLAKYLFSAIDSNRPTKIILIGDIEQLPSVGAGNVLNDIIASGKVKVVKLDVVKRQAENSQIVKNANRVIAGEMLQIDKEKRDFLFVQEEDKNSVADLMVMSVAALLNKEKYNYTIEDIQIICPQRTSEIGTEVMNKRIQEIVNPPSEDKKEMKKKGANGELAIFRVGDRVMHTKNNYEKEHYGKAGDNYYPKGEKFKGVFNGDTGTVLDIAEIKDEETGENIESLVVKYDDYLVLYESGDLSDIEHCFAISIHKSQGSQFPIALIPFHFRNYIMLNRNLGYTAISRAKEIVCLFGQVKAIKRMINNVVITQRNTRLRYII